MKYPVVVLTAACLCLAACSGTHEVAVPAERLEVISMTPLPPISLAQYARGMKLNVLVHVLEDGTVGNVRMLGSSGDAEWDSLAVHAMKQWRYAAPQRDGKPADLWFRQLVVVQIQDPIVMTIGELASASLREADSLYALLEEGRGLDTLFKECLGTCDIAYYPPDVRNRLKRLTMGDYTRPLRVGDRYVIYKRFRGSSF